MAQLTIMQTRRFQLVSLPVSQLGNMSASPSVIVDNIAKACGFGANEQARDLQYDSGSTMLYISTQQCVHPIVKPAKTSLLSQLHSRSQSTALTHARPSRSGTTIRVRSTSATPPTHLGHWQARAKGRRLASA